MRLYTDFQAVNPDGFCWILRQEIVDPLDKINDLGLKKGDRVVLDACEDFQVLGVLDFRFVDDLGREGWVALPDWSTRVDKPTAAPSLRKAG